MNLPRTIKRTAAAVKRRGWGDALVRRNPLYYARVRRTLEDLEHRPLEGRVEWTRRRLHRVLAAAASTPYGRQVRGTTDLGSWPILEKQAVRESPLALLTRPAITLAPATTSGTSGHPMRLWRTLLSIAAEQAYIDALCARHGLGLRHARTAVLRGDPATRDAKGGLQLWTRQTHGLGRLAMSANHLSPQTIGSYASQLRSFAPDCLLAYPDALASLLSLLVQAHETASVPFVLTSSEVLPAETRRAAERTLGAKVLDYYGQAERVAFGWSDDGGRFWFSPGYGLVELLPCDADPERFEIVATGLWNLAMPLVRYRTGDLLIVRGGADAQLLQSIAFGVQPFHGIVGRQNDYLLTPDGVRISGAGLTLIPRDFESVLKVQFLQEAPDRVRLLVLPLPGFTDQQRNELLSVARAKIPESIAVSVEVVSELRRTARGKSPFVVRSFEENPRGDS